MALISLRMQALAWVSLCVCVVQQVTGESLRVEIAGQDGRPVPSAVIELTAAPMFSGTAARAEVDQRDRRFVPYVSLARPGHPVYFPNSDDTRHSVYSFSGDNSFELQLYRANEAPPVTFSEGGVVKLGCNIHDSMKAYVYLTDNRSTVITGEDGRAVLEDSGLARGSELRVWHPQLSEALLLQVQQSDLEAGVLQLNLEIVWSEPQQGKSADELEQLLKSFSRDAN